MFLSWLTDGHEGCDLNHVSAKWRHLGPSWNRHTHHARLLQLSPATRFTINVGTRLNSFCSRRQAQDATISIMAAGRTESHVVSVLFFQSKPLRVSESQKVRGVSNARSSVVL